MKGSLFVIVLIAILLHATLGCCASYRTLCPPVLTQHSCFVLAADSTLTVAGLAVCAIAFAALTASGRLPGGGQGQSY